MHVNNIEPEMVLPPRNYRAIENAENVARNDAIQPGPDCTIDEVIDTHQVPNYVLHFIVHFFKSGSLIVFAC